MIRMAGNCLLIILVSLICLPAFARMQVAMRAVDDQGQELVQAAAGHSFTLEVRIENATASAQAPRIAGLDPFDVHRTGVAMNIINGVASVKYTYRMRVDTPGSYTLGPAEVVDGSEVGHSKTLKLNVGTSVVVQAPKPSNSKNQESRRAFLKLSANKDRAVVGEKIICTIRFYYNDDTISLHGIRTPEFTGFSFSDKKGPFAGTQVIDGVTYSYTEWRWDLFAQEPGTRVIPVFNAEITQRIEEETIFSGFGLFRAMQEKKRIYSNPIKIDVEQLPAHKPPVRAVGDFRSFVAIVDQPIMKEGEAAVLAFELEGDGNFDALHGIDIAGIPDAFKWFSSKATLVPDTSDVNRMKKRYEFVLQGMKPGDWEIPAQTFTYFDVARKQYNTLRSQPVVLTVMPQPLRSKPIVNQPQQSEAAQDLAAKELPRLSQQESFLLCVDYGFENDRDRCMPWWLFLFLASMPFGMLFMNYCRRIVQPQLHARAARLRSRNAFSVARAQLKEIAKKSDDTQLYALFLQLFADRLSIPVNEISEEFLENMVRQRGFSESDIADWRDFFTQLSGTRFSGNSRVRNALGLIGRARIWMDKLETKL